jgi:hypothetical protein
MEPLTSREWSVHVSDGALLEHIVVDFAVTRTRFARVELRAGEVSLDLVCKGYRAETFPQTVMPNDSVLRVLFTGDMPHIAQVHWVSTQPNLIPTVLPSRPAAHRTAGEEADLLDDAVPVRTAAAGEFDLEPAIDQAAAFELRRQAIREDYAARCFFAALDELTSDTQVEPKLQDLSWYLRSRIVRRALRARQEVPAVPVFDRLEKIGDDALLPALQRVSALFWRLARHHLGGGNSAELVAWSFDLFSTNSLAVSHRDYAKHRLLMGHGAPDGVQFLFFTELAFTCVAENVDAADWPLLVPTLVRATEQFLDVRRLNAGTGTMASPSYAMPDEWQVSRGRSERIKAYYDCVLSNPATGDAMTALENRFSYLVGRALFRQTGAPSGSSRPLRPWPSPDAISCPPIA